MPEVKIVFYCLSVFIIFVRGIEGLPSAASWESLNRTVHGRLRSATPFALPCFSRYNGQPRQPDVSACAAVQENWGAGAYRTEFYSGFMHSQDEICASSSSSTARQCLLDPTNPANAEAFTNTSCFQGSVSSYYVELEEASDVQAAFAWAKSTGVTLSIKNSGHDYQTRSSLRGSLALWTRKLRHLSHDAAFVPSGCSTQDTYNAITTGGGVNFDEVFRFADERNVTYIGGSSPTVGASGGWLMNGGHGLLTAQYGLGIDRVLQFKIVTPDGVLRTANSCQNQDLFWALRGGGGGTYGVVLEATSLVEPVLPVILASISFPATPSNTAPFTELLIKHSLTWAAEGWGGPMSSNFIASVNPYLNLTAARASMAAVSAYALSQNGTVVIEAQPKWYPLYENFIKPTGDTGVGIALLPTNRLIPSDLLNASTGQAAVQRYLTNLVATGYSPTIFATTPVRYRYLTNSTSATPAWRDSTWLVVTSTAWAWNSTVPEKQAAVRTLHGLTTDLEALAPTSGSYANEADPWTVDWRRAWWGDNYPALLRLKKQYDPHSLLQCWRCVGWEEGRLQAQGQTFECMAAVDKI